MLKNKSLTTEIFFATLAGGIVGFILPAAIGESVILEKPGLGGILTASPFSLIITTTVLGMAVGGITGAIFKRSRYSVAGQNNDENVKFKLH